MERIIGKTPASVDVTGDTIDMAFTDGSSCQWIHFRDCCECVVIEDVNGDWGDLIGHPLVVAEERTSNDYGEKHNDSDTWTFYTFRSNGGSVDVRWHGSSSGYYSESVDFCFIEDAHDTTPTNH